MAYHPHKPPKSSPQQQQSNSPKIIYKSNTIYPACTLTVLSIVAMLFCTFIRQVKTSK
jgi:hypothetical protein